MTKTERDLIESAARNLNVLLQYDKGDGPAGSGAIACCADAERSTQAGAEESREDSPGCAGEAREALVWAWKQAQIEGIAADYLATEAEESGDDDSAEVHRRESARLLEYTKTLHSLIPKPDSEARNERSGRRNSPGHGPT